MLACLPPWMVHGQRADVPKLVGKLVSTLSTNLQTKSGIAFAQDKWAVTRTHRSLGRAVARALKLDGIEARYSATIRNLGADFAGGAVCGGPTQDARIQKMRLRGKRINALKAKGKPVHRFFTVASLPMGMYASDINGVNPSRLYQLRGVCAAKACMGAAGGRTLGLTLEMCPSTMYDPTFRASAGPIRTWAAAVWTGRFQESLQAAFRVGSRVTSWRNCRGPAGALRLTLARIGWASVAWDRWTDEREHDILLTQVCRPCKRGRRQAAAAGHGCHPGERRPGGGDLHRSNSHGGPSAHSRARRQRRGRVSA